MDSIKTQLRIACWNARGYLSAIPYIRELLKEVDVLAVSEHWLHANRLRILDGISSTHNCHAHASRPAAAENYGCKRGQGGVALFWRKDMGGISKVTDIVHDRVCVIRVQLDNGSVLNIMSVYLPAQGSEDSFSECIDELTEIVESRENNSISIICGDFNGDLRAQRGLGAGVRPNRQGASIEQFLGRHNLFRPT